MHNWESIINTSVPGKDLVVKMLNQIEKDGHVVLAVFRYGSHLYGTDTDDSDNDYYVLFFPSARSLIVGGGAKSYRLSTGDDNAKNRPNDVDVQASSIRETLRRFGRGEIVAIDTFFALTNQEAVLYANGTYKSWWKRTAGLLGAGNLGGVLGYINKQASKYGLKGTRLGTAIRLAESLKSFVGRNPSASILDWISDTGEELVFVEPFVQAIELMAALPGGTHSLVDGIDALGKKFTLISPARNLLNSLENTIKKYGHRAAIAKENMGVDWKALAHAYRGATEYQLLRKTNMVTFPLKGKDVEIIKSIKSGRLPFDKVASLVEEQVAIVSELRNDQSSIGKQVGTDEALISLFTELVYADDITCEDVLGMPLSRVFD